GGGETGLGAISHPDDTDQALAGRAAQPDGEVVEERECERRDQQSPKEPVTEVGAEDRVGGDPGGVVVGQAGQNSRAHDRQQSKREPALACPDASRTYAVAMAPQAPSRWHAHKATSLRREAADQV